MAEQPYPLKSREADTSMLLKGKWIVSLLLFIIAASAIAMIWIYQVNPGICNGCARCIPYCTTGALSMYGSNAVIDPALCKAAVIVFRPAYAERFTSSGT